MNIEKIQKLKRVIGKLAAASLLFALAACENGSKSSEIDNKALLAVLSTSSQPQNTFDENDQTSFRQIVVSHFSKYSGIASENKEKDVSFAQEIQEDLTKVTYSVLRAKGEKEVRNSSQVIKTLLEPDSIAQFEATLDDLSNPLQLRLLCF